MKFKYFFLVLFVLSATLYYACTKTRNNNSSESADLITAAKENFEEMVVNIPPKSTISQSEAYVQHLGKAPQWQKAYTMSIPEGTGVVVPLHYGGQFLIHSTKDPMRGYSLDDISKLLIYKDKNGQFVTQVVTGIPDTAYIPGKTPFRGIVTSRTWQGEFLSNYVVTCTGILGTTAPILQEAPQPVRNGKKIATETLTSCSIFYGYNYAAGDPSNNFSYSEEVCNTYTVASPGFYTLAQSGPVSVIVSGNPPPGGASSSSSPGIQQMRDSLTTPCFVSVLNSVLAAGDLSDLTEILNDMGNGDMITYVVRERPGTDPLFSANTDINAITNYTLVGGYITIFMTLNTTMMASASQEAIAETILHELLHAYDDAYSPYRGNIPQHGDMIANWIDEEWLALHAVFPDLSQDDAVCIIMGGLAAEDETGNLEYNTELNKYNLTASEVTETNTAYRNGTSGTKCQ